MATAEQLLTAKEYFRSSPDYERSELVRGVVVPLVLDGLQHGGICGNIVYQLAKYLKGNDLGRVCCNGTGVITQRDPDTVRGADVCFYDNDKLPRGTSPEGYNATPPNFVFEVRSPSDRWSLIHEKIAEYLRASVQLVCVMVPETQEAQLFYPDRPVEIRQGDQVLTLPTPLEEFQQPVAKFFDVG